MRGGPGGGGPGGGGRGRGGFGPGMMIAPQMLSQADKDGDQLLRHALARLLLSARAYHRVLRVARTIADLAGDTAIRATHIAEAIQYRRLDASF